MSIPIKRHIYKIVLVILYFISVSIIIHNSLNDPRFNPQDETALFHSETAFHYRHARMVAKGEAIPEIDYEIQHPEGLDIDAHVTIFMEYITGYAYRLFSTVKELPFHVFLIYFVPLFSRLIIFPVYGITRYLFGSSTAAICSTAVYAVSPATLAARSTASFLREDFALPIIAFFFFFFIRSLHRETKNQPLYAVVSGIFLIISLAAWHLTQFIFALFVLYILICLLVKPSVDERLMIHFSIVTGLLAVSALMLSTLRAGYFAISFSMLVSYALVFSWLLQKWLKLSKSKMLIGFGACLVVMIALFAYVLFPQHYKTYSHVYNFIIEKVWFFGQKPDNPNLLSFDTKVMWLGPFNNLGLYEFVYFFSLLILLAILPAFSMGKKLLRRSIASEELLMLFFTAASFVLALIIRRLMILPVFFLIILSGWTLHRLVTKKAGIVIMCLLIYFNFNESYTYKTKTTHYRTLVRKWFPPVRNIYEACSREDTRDLINWIKANTETTSAILTSFRLGPDICAYANRAVALHSKFESRKIRDKVKKFMYALYRDEPAFHNLCKELKIDYFVYTARFLLDHTKDSNRYISGNLVVNKDCAAYKFHFAPVRLKFFDMVYQNDYYRIFKVDGRNSCNTKDQTAPALFNVKFFILKADSDTFDDSKTDQALKRFNTSIAQHRLGIRYFRQKQYDEAQVQFKEVLRINPFLWQARWNLAIIYLKKGFYGDATKELEMLVTLQPGRAEFYNNLGGCYIRANKFDEAVAVLKKAYELESDPAKKTVIKKNVDIAMGMSALHKRGKPHIK
jgi:tetratricopeptide (TPR) repeat protein